MAIRGCLLNKTADETGSDYSAGATVAWTREIYDTGGFHAANDDAIIIPSAVNGRYGVFTAFLSLSSVSANNNCIVSIRRGASIEYIGWVGTTRHMQGNGQQTTSGWMQISSGPVLLTTGEEYDVHLTSSDNNINIESESSFGLVVIDSTTQIQRVLAKMNADQTTANYSTPAAVAFDGADVYDTDAIHDPSSNNTKLIIPPALDGKYVRVGAQVLLAAATAGQVCSVAIRKGGSLTYDGIGANSGQIAQLAEAWVQAQTQVIQVSTGDEFELLLYSSDTSVTVESDVTSFGLRVVG